MTGRWRYFERTAGTLASILEGMGITLRHLASPAVTIQYPEERWVPPPAFRGMPALLSNADGSLRCTACKACERACPAGAIRVLADLVEEGGRTRLALREYTVDLGRCLVCGLCAEGCPSEALTMAPDYELAALDQAGLVAGTERLAAAGRACRYNNQQRLPEGYGAGRVERGVTR